MTALDFLYICLGIGFLALVGVIVYVLFSLGTFLFAASKFVKEIQLMRYGLKLGVLSFIQNILKRR